MTTAQTQELLDALKDILMGANMMLQPIPLLSANKPLCRYASEVARVAKAAIEQAQLAAAPHSWQTEDHSEAAPQLSDEHEMPATDPWAHPSRAEAL